MGGGGEGNAAWASCTAYKSLGKQKILVWVLQKQGTALPPPLTATRERFRDFSSRIKINTYIQYYLSSPLFHSLHLAAKEIKKRSGKSYINFRPPVCKRFLAIWNLPRCWPIGAVWITVCTTSALPMFTDYVLNLIIFCFTCSPFLNRQGESRTILPTRQDWFQILEQRLRHC